MAKKRINTYKFTPGIPQSGNLYPNAWAQINANKEWLKDESNAFLDFKITQEIYDNIASAGILKMHNDSTRNLKMSKQYSKLNVRKKLL